MAQKRYRVPEPKSDTLHVCWGRPDQFSRPSLVYVYPDRDGKAASRLISDALEGERYVPTFIPRGYTVEKSLAKELEERGYDLTTLKLTIKKKAQPEAQGIASPKTANTPE